MVFKRKNTQTCINARTKWYSKERIHKRVSMLELNGIQKKEYTNVFQLLELYTYCSMYKQHVEGVQNRKKLLHVGK